MNLDRILNTIGKRCFRNCYEIASKKGQDLNINDLLKYDPILRNTEASALRTRLKAIKRIFRENLQEEALELSKNAKNYKNKDNN